jgi:hypothetical protein
MLVRQGTRPTDYAITLVSVEPRYKNGWLYSDEVRGRLRWLGFEVSSQFVVARLTAMLNEDAPRFERRDHFGREKQYRATQFGRNEIHNRMPGMRDV